MIIGPSQDIVITGNIIQVPSPPNAIKARAGSIVVNNFGYNPVGSISNPWPSTSATSADLTNLVSAGKLNPQSGTMYPVRQTPKTIVIHGGDVSQILINDANAGTAGAFKLGMKRRSPSPTILQLRLRLRLSLQSRRVCCATIRTPVDPPYHASGQAAFLLRGIHSLVPGAAHWVNCARSTKVAGWALLKIRKLGGLSIRKKSASI